jgi:hypothetical protein
MENIMLGSSKRLPDRPKERVMSTYAIDTDRQPFVGTGIVQPVMEWVVTAEGTRRPGDVQARDEDTGMPLWGVEVSYRTETFGRESTATALVTVGSVDRPQPAAYTPITFEGLRVNVYPTKSGGFSERWSADSVRQMTPENTRPKAGEAKQVDPKAVA